MPYGAQTRLHVNETVTEFESCVMPYGAQTVCG